MSKDSRSVLVTGLPHFAHRIGRLIASNAWHVCVRTPQAFTDANRRRFERGRLLASLPFYDLMYQIGGPTVDRRAIYLCSSLRRPIILHWVGSDVSAAGTQLRIQRDHLEEIVHWVDSPWLQAELLEVGIKSSILPSSAVAPASSIPLPPGPLTVLLYLPTVRWEAYRGPQIAQLAGELPNVNFLVVGDAGAGRYAANNVNYLGWVKDMTAIYSKIHVLVRMPVHDGQSAMVIEALSHGRHVIWNYPMPGVFLASTAEQVVAQLAKLASDHAAHQLSLNLVGKLYVEANFSETMVAKEIRAGFESAFVKSLDRPAPNLTYQIGIDSDVVAREPESSPANQPR